MKLQEAIEQAKVAFQETFGPEGYAHCRLEGWEDDGVCWIVILSAEFIPPGRYRCPYSVSADRRPTHIPQG